MAVVVIVLGGLGLLMLVAAVVYVVRQSRFQNPGADSEASDGKADLFVNRAGGGGL